MKPYTALPGVATNHFFQNVGQSALSAIAIDVQKVGLFPVDFLFGVVFWKWDKILSFYCLHIFTFVVSRAFMAGAASQAGDADSSRAPGLTSGLQGSVNVHRGALLLVPQ